MSAKVYKFPDIGKDTKPEAAVTSDSRNRFAALAAIALPRIVYVVWITIVIIWPFLKWIIALDVLYQFCRALYFWSTPGMLAGWYALFHSGVFIAVTYFVEFYGPRKF